jgi:predicted GNAT family N-acyltransferase
MSLIIKQAVKRDLLAVCAVMCEVAQWLIDKGEPLWSLEQFSEEVLSELINEDRLYLVQKENAVIGAFILQTDDERFWTDSKTTKAFYIHKLCISRKVAGQGVVQSILEWVKTKAKSEGKNFVRLDCAPRAKLCKIYEDLGFKKHSQGHVGEFKIVRYEMTVA